MTHVLHNLLKQSVRNRPDKTALHIGKAQYSFVQLDQMSDNVAQHLLANNLAGQQIAYLLPNSLALVLLYLACFKVGATAIPLNYRLAAPEVQMMLADCQPQWLITDSLEQLDMLNLDQTTIRKVFVAGQPQKPDVVDFNTLLSPPKSIQALPKISADQNSVILYTSGSTGQPKGVVHTHLSLSEAFFHIQPIAQFDADSIMLVAGPIYHAGALAEQLLPIFYYGGTLILLSQYSNDAKMKAFQKYKPTHFQSNPITLQEIINHPQFGSTDFGALRYYLVGGDSVAPDLLTQFHLHTGLSPYQGFGCTEAFVNIINQEKDPTKWAAIGRPLLSSNIRILNEDNQDCAPNQPGEMLIQAPTQMKHYWQAPEKTAEVMYQGFYRTGDMVYRDEDGLLWFASRKKHIIVRKGSNIWPREIEQVLLQHPSVDKAGVVGLKCQAEGEVPYAFISIFDQQSVDTDDILHFVQARLAQYKWPVAIECIDKMPIGNTGKVDRKTLQIRLNEKKI